MVLWWVRLFVLCVFVVVCGCCCVWLCVLVVLCFDAGGFVLVWVFGVVLVCGGGCFYGVFGFWCGGKFLWFFLVGVGFFFVLFFFCCWLYFLFFFFGLSCFVWWGFCVWCVVVFGAFFLVEACLFFFFCFFCCEC